MESRLSEQTLWVEETAARLRLLQSSLSDEEAATRQRFLAEEVERSLKGIVAGKRKACLEELSNRFPTWETAGAASVPAPAAPPAVDETPEALVQRLVQAVPDLSESRKAQLAELLRKAGVSVTVRTEASLEIPQDLVTKMCLPPGRELDLERAIKLLAGLLEWTALLEKPAWKIWGALAPPKTPVKREPLPGGDFKAFAGRYLSDDPDTSSQQMSQALGNSRRLIAGLLAALAPASKKYAEQYFYRFSPDAIRELAQMEKGWATIESKCWNKYVDLAAGFSTQASIEKELRDIIAVCAEEMMLGPAANAP